MQKRQVIRVKASFLLGSPRTKGIVVKVLHEMGTKEYPMGLLLVQCVDSPLGIFDHVDFTGTIYSGPPDVNGVLARFA